MLRHCWFGDTNGTQPVKNGCWFVGDDILTGALQFAHLIAPVVTTSSITLSSNKIQNEDILELGNQGPPGTRLLKPREMLHSPCIQCTNYLYFKMQNDSQLVMTFNLHRSEATDLQYLEHLQTG